MSSAISKYFEQIVNEKIDSKFAELESRIMDAIPIETHKSVLNIFKEEMSVSTKEKNDIKAVAKESKHEVKAVAKPKKNVGIKMTAGKELYNAITAYDVYDLAIKNGFIDITSTRQKDNGTLCLYDGAKHIYSFINHGDHIVCRTGFIKKGKISKTKNTYRKGVVINPSTENVYTVKTKKSNFYKYNMYRSAINDMIAKKND